MRRIAKKAAAFAIAVAVLLCGVGAAFTGCSTTDPDGGPVNTSGVVYSNGGTVVQYGDYVYFINGIPDYTDENGTSNVAGNVIKGGLYRTEIDWQRRDSVSEAMNDELERLKDDARFADPDDESDKGFDEVDYEKTEARATTLRDVLDFKHEVKDYIQLGEYTIGNEDGSELPTYTDENGKVRQNFVPTADKSGEYGVVSERVVGKKIGTSGYDGGFWIYDGIVYFASPSVDRDTEGNVEYTRPSFWAYNIASGSLNELYSATEDSASVPYAFYKEGNNVYLATFENYYANADDEEAGDLTGYIVVNRISGTRVVETYELVEDVTAAYFFVAETYDPDSDILSAHDFIYYTRDNTENDHDPDGTTLEMVYAAARPGDDTARFTVTSAASGTIGVEGIEGEERGASSEGGYLYYTMTGASGTTRLAIDDLGHQISTFAQESGDERATMIAPELRDTVLCEDTSAYTTILPVPQDEYNMNAPAFMGENSDGIFRVTADGRTQVYNGSITLVGYSDGRIYCTLESAQEDTEEGEDTDDSESETASAFVSASAFQDYNNQTATILNFGVVPTTTPFSLDFVDLDFGEVEGATADTVETYVSYFATYGGSMTDYMYLNKVSGRWESASTSNLKVGEVIYSEKPAITCYDHNCLNFLHDHSSWDDYTPDEEEGTTGEDGMVM